MKEAIAVVLDVGKLMLKCDEGSHSVLQNAKSCISMIIQRKIFSESKDEIALVLFGTLETVNSMATCNTSEFNNIKVAQDLKPASWELLQYINEIDGTDIQAEFIKDNALLVALDLLQNISDEKKFSSRRILLLSHFSDFFSAEKIARICTEFKSFKIDLNLIGPVAFGDDISNGNCIQTYRNEAAEQIKSENTITMLLREVNGESYSFSEAIPALIYYQKKKVQPLPWNANLDIGKNLTIPISGYIKVNESKSKPWKSAYALKLNAKVEKEVSFHLNDEAQTEVLRDNIIPAYRYGTTLVPFSDEDKINMEYQSGEKGMKVLGFTKEENIHRYHYVGDKSLYIFGQKNRELAGVILAPFIQALYDTKMVAIVRYVYSSRSTPKIGFLSPRIKPTYECLVFIALPFMEDLRHFVFSPLDMDSKNLPSEEQLNAVDDLIIAMDLSIAAKDEDGNRGEGLKPKNTVNPYLQKLYQCLQHRAFYPESPLPGIPLHIERIVVPSPELAASAEPVLKQIKRIFPLKEIFKKGEESGVPNGKNDSGSKKKKTSNEQSTEVIYSAIESANENITMVGSVHPVRDYIYLMNQPERNFRNICQQMEETILHFISDAMLKLHHDKILSCIQEYRNYSVKEDDVILYNTFIQNLKVKMSVKVPELWNEITKECLGLISSEECTSSTVLPMQAADFFSSVHHSILKDSEIEAVEMNNADDNVLVNIF